MRDNWVVDVIVLPWSNNECNDASRHPFVSNATHIEGKTSGRALVIWPD